jgi:hypothetical protein
VEVPSPYRLDMSDGPVSKACLAGGLAAADVAEAAAVELVAQGHTSA